MSDFNKAELMFCQKCGKTIEFTIAFDYTIVYREEKKSDIKEEINISVYEHLDEQEYDSTQSSIIIENKTSNQILECPSCKNIIFKKITYEDSIPVESFIYPDNQSWQMVPKSYIMDLLSIELSDIYREIIKAYNNKLLLSTAACIRTFIEAICKANKIKDKDIYNMIDKLPIERTYIDVLQKIRIISNISLHQGSPAASSILRDSIRAIEILVNNIYEKNIKEKEYNDILTITKNLEMHPIKRR